MNNAMKVITNHLGLKIYFINLFQQYAVLYPKGDGTSTMNRFGSVEEAKKFIEESKKADTEKKFWWEDKEDK